MLKVDVAGAERLAACVREYGAESDRLIRAIRTCLEELRAAAAQFPEPARSALRRAALDTTETVADPLGARPVARRAEDIARAIDEQVKDAKIFDGHGTSPLDSAWGAITDVVGDGRELLTDLTGIDSAGLILLTPGMAGPVALAPSFQARAQRLVRINVGIARRVLGSAGHVVNDTFIAVSARHHKNVPVRMRKSGDALRATSILKPGEVGVIQTGQNSYVVVVRGMAVNSVGANGTPGTLNTYVTNNSQLTQGTTKAMLDAIPAGANVKLVGHSQGGMSVMDIAANRHIADRYHITHVETIGSPAQHKDAPANASTKVLHVDNAEDEVPELDGGVTTSGGAQYVFVGEDDGALGPQHGTNRYSQELNSERFLQSSQYQDFSRGDEQYSSPGSSQMRVYEIDSDVKIPKLPH
ncbi:MAG: hypothetical protein HOQ05_01380 [Corynebacteriales bacterium]|nr:hypothetical protein [Mycobacteriales bacterium]